MEHLLLDQLCKSNIKSGDHAIFSLTSPARDMYYAEDTNTVDLDAPSDPDEMNDVQYNWKSAMCCLECIVFVYKIILLLGLLTL